MRNIALLTVLLLQHPHRLFLEVIFQIFSSQQKTVRDEEDITIPEGKKSRNQSRMHSSFKPFTGITAEGTLVIDGTPEQMVI